MSIPYVKGIFSTTFEGEYGVSGKQLEVVLRMLIKGIMVYGAQEVSELEVLNDCDEDEENGASYTSKAYVTIGRDDENRFSLIKFIYDEKEKALVTVFPLFPISEEALQFTIESLAQENIAEGRSRTQQSELMSNKGLQRVAREMSSESMPSGRLTRKTRRVISKNSEMIGNAENKEAKMS